MSDGPPRITWPPRLLAAHFHGPRPFRDAAFLPLKALTVLFGANGAGKTTTLGVLSQCLPSLAATVARPRDPDTRCTFFVQVTDDQLEQLAEDAIASQRQGDGPAIRWTGDGFPTSSRYEPVEGPDAPGAWLNMLTRGLPETSSETLALVDQLSESRIVAVNSTTPAGPYELSWCLPPTTAGEVPQPVAPLGVTTRTMLPVAVSVPRAADEIADELRDSVLAILDHLRWSERDRWANAHNVPLPEIATRRGTQAWLENPDSDVAAISEDGRAICHLASLLATELAPTFVSEGHSIRVTIPPIHQWEKGGPSLALELARSDDAVYPLSKAADGHRIWLQLTLLETVSILRRYLELLDTLFARSQTDANVGRARDDYEGTVALLRTFSRRGEPSPAALRQFKELRNIGHRLYLIDEPEQHLHPRVQRSAADWLAGEGTAGASQVVVVTHSPHYLRLPGDVGFNHLRNAPGRSTNSHSVISELSPELLGATDDIAQEMGFDRGELLTSVAAFVFVEGQADKLMLEAFCAAELHHAGIALIPIHGAVHADRKGVVDSELVLGWTAARIAVLLDNLAEDEWSRLQSDPDYCREQSRKSKKLELKAMAQILVRAKELGRDIIPVGIPVPDIFDLLDDSTITDLYPAFPGHAAARAAFDEHSETASQKMGWKAFYKDTYGIAVEPSLFAEIGAQMAARGARSDALSELIERIKNLSTA